MCGLAGTAAIGTGRASAGNDELLRRMTRTIAHRGPDDTAYLHDGPLSFGFVRLSLVDPEGGGQPLTTPDGSIALIANGEIYNHKELAATLPAGTPLRTGSDCEVLLYLYQRDGLAFLDNVRGMFSLVLWDRTRNRLVIARDRFGIKPLFLHQNGERIVFASEIKALLCDPACPRELDWERAMADQLMTGDLSFDHSAPHAWFRDIELAPAATITTFDLITGRRAEHRYWSFPDFDPAGTATEGELVDSYAETLAQSVHDCEMADVEIGLFLSGGIDSAAVAALAKGKPETFTSLSGATLLNTDAEFAHRMAVHLGLINHQVLFDITQTPGVEEWKQFVWQLETPLAGPESYFKYEMYRYVRATSPGIKAMLLGGGADEFNGGYAQMLSGGGGWVGFCDTIGRMSVRRLRERSPGLSAWWDQPRPPLLRTEALRARSGSEQDSPLLAYTRWKYRDVLMYNCWHEDRTAAGNGIEARVPFLDHRLIELAAAIPPELRETLLWDKQILRRGMVGVLPTEFVARPKIPFYHGEGVAHCNRAFARMLAQEGGALVEEATSSDEARFFLDLDNVRAWLGDIEQSPGTGEIERVLQVINLGLLHNMSRQLPDPLVSTAKAVVASSIEVTDWDTQTDQIEFEVLCRQPIADGDVFALRDDVLLLRPSNDVATLFLVKNGEIEFVVDCEENPNWVAFLENLDGTTPCAVIAGPGGVAKLDQLIHRSLDAGLLERVPT